MKGQEIGELLRICRERSGLSQLQLANLLHVDRTTVTKIETGAVKHPSYSIVKEWAQATNSTEIIGLEFCGTDAWKKLRQLETAMQTIKSAVDLVKFFKRPTKGGAKQIDRHQDSERLSGSTQAVSAKSMGS